MFACMTITIHFKLTLEETTNSNGYAGMHAKSAQRFPPKCFSYDQKWVVTVLTHHTPELNVVVIQIGFLYSQHSLY